MSTQTPTRRLSRSSRRDDTADLARPLPPVLAAELEGSAEHERHAVYAGRFLELRERVRKLAADHQAAVVADERAEQTWQKSTGRKPLPKQKAPRIEEQLEEARRELALAAGALPDAVQALVDAAVAHVDVAEKRVREALDADAAEVRDLIAAALTLLARRSEHAMQLVWLDQLVWQQPPPSPWGERRPNPGGAAAIALREALTALADEERRAVEHRREIAIRREMEFVGPGQPREIGGQSPRVRREAAIERVERREAGAAVDFQRGEDEKEGQR